MQTDNTQKPSGPWRDENKLASRRRLRRIGRAAVSVGLAGALFLFGVWLVNPFQKPNVHFVISSASFDIVQSNPTPFTPVDREAWNSLTSTHSLTGEVPSVELRRDELLAQIAAINDSCAIGDQLIVSITSHGVAIDGKPFLYGQGFTPQHEDSTLVSVAEILGAIQSVQCRTKLLILDGGQVKNDARVGAVANEFPNAVKTVVENMGDPSIYVLLSHSSGQISEFSPQFGQSVFAHFTQSALAGKADRNKDRILEPAELIAFVKAKTSQYVVASSAGRARQSPQLIYSKPTASRSRTNLIYLPKVQSTINETALRKLPWKQLSSEQSESKPEDQPAAKDTDQEITPKMRLQRESEVLAKLVTDGWRLRDSMLTSFDDRVDAPHLWRELEASLVGAEQACRFGDREVVRNATKQLKDRLEYWSESTNTPSQKPPSVLFRLTKDDSTTIDGETLEKQWQLLLEAVKKNGIQKWVADNWTSELEELYEFRLAKRLADSGLTDTKLFADALSLRQSAGQLSNRSFDISAASHPKLKTADAFRITAEALLVNREGADWKQQARAAMASARRNYDRVEYQTNSIEQARLTNLLAHQQSSWFLDWYASLSTEDSTWAPDGSLLLAFYRKANELSDALAANDNSPERMTELAQAVSDILDSIQTILDDGVERLVAVRSRNADDEWLIERLLSSPLLQSHQRIKLLQLAGGHKSFTGIQKVHAPIPRPSSTHRYVELLLHSLRLGTINGADHRTEIDSLLDLSTDPPNLAELSRQLRAIQSEWIQRSTELSANLNQLNPENVAAAARELERILSVIDPRDADGIAGVRLQPTFDELSADNRLRMQSLRFREFGSHLQSSDDYDEELAEQFSSQRRLLFPQAEADVDVKSIRLETQSLVSLESTEKQVIELSLSSAEPSQLWIVANYDATLLRVEGRRNAIYRTDDFPADQADAIFKKAPTIKFEGGEPKTISIQVSRQTDSDQIITRPATEVTLAIVSPKESIKRTIDVALPRPEVLSVRVDGVTGSWSESRGQLSLHPRPNQVSTYYLRLRNNDVVERNVDVKLFGLPKSLTTLPESPSSIAESRKLIDSLSEHEIASIANLKLASKHETRLPFSKYSKAKAGPSSTTKPLRLDAGLIVVTTDAARDEVTIQPVTIEPQRPRRYVTSTLTYDASLRRARVKVSALDAKTIPKKGIRVTAELATDSLEPMDGVYAGVIKPKSSSLTLDVKLPRGRPTDQTIYLHVDDYPRAFRYNIPSIQRSGPISETTDHLEVAVVAPSERLSLNKEAKTIQTQLRVDAPLGAFSNTRDKLVVGLDVENDRELEGDPQVILFSDRNVDSTVVAMQATGMLQLQTMVTDQIVELPLGSSTNAHSSILCQLEVGGHKAAAHSPQPIILDSIPPKIESVWVPSGNRVGQGAMLTVFAATSDQQLSGTEKVEAVVDTDFIGEFAPDAKLTRGALEGGVGWKLQVPTKGLDLGAHTVLIRSTDHAGNVSDYEKLAIIVVDKDSIDQRPFNSVSGKVTFGSMKGAAFKVALKTEAKNAHIPPATTDTDGSFKFPKVPAGRYQVTAQGLLRNMPLVGAASIDVKGPPAKGTTIDIPVRLPK